MSATTSSMDAVRLDVQDRLQHYFLDPLIGSLPANASEQQALEAESSIVRLLRGRHDSRTFEVSEISPNEAYLKHLLSAGRPR